jgi:hypothetical protein
LLLNKRNDSLVAKIMKNKEAALKPTGKIFNGCGQSSCFFDVIVLSLWLINKPRSR